MTRLRPVDNLEPLLSRESLAGRLECSVDTIDRMRAQGMPYIRWGRRFVRYRYSACMAWLDEQTRKAA